ncbi:EthD domain-containing protein [Paenibacillus elgii]|uniref:EthD domain-containing protein n=1 Tax=Paenibacillus elgii TaxID=189691 RepID=UPI00203AAE37|nr:EthD domain-containing protein [Paenibacillus elgii]MCM3270738.1 EthD domain-containing protein [Paenibacillus elgii]
MKQHSPRESEFSHRSPYLDNYRSFREPMTVLASLLSRADNTPLDQRRRDPNTLLDQEGKAIADPAVPSQKLALGGDPNTSYEKWAEYWRKVHGPRFIYAQDTEEGKIRHLARYDQVHRISAGPTHFTPPPYVAPTDANGELYDTVIGHIPEYRRPDWDGMAYLAFNTPDDLKAVFSQEKLRTKIVPEDQAIFRELAPVVATEHIILPSATQRDPILLVKIHRRQEGMSREEFQEHWLRQHASLVLAKSATHKYVKRYVQLHNIGPVSEGEPFWHPVSSGIDGITIMAFANMNDVEDFLMTDDYSEIEKDERRIADPKASEYWTGLNYNVVNRVYPEHATIR